MPYHHYGIRTQRCRRRRVRPVSDRPRSQRRTSRVGERLQQKAMSRVWRSSRPLRDIVYRLWVGPSRIAPSYRRARAPFARIDPFFAAAASNSDAIANSGGIFLFEPSIQLLRIVSVQEHGETKCRNAKTAVHSSLTRTLVCSPRPGSRIPASVQNVKTRSVTARRFAPPAHPEAVDRSNASTRRRSSVSIFSHETHVTYRCRGPVWV